MDASYYVSKDSSLRGSATDESASLSADYDSSEDEFPSLFNNPRNQRQRWRQNGRSNRAADARNGRSDPAADRRNGVGNRRADRMNGRNNNICWECNGVPQTQYCECRDGPRRNRQGGNMANRWVNRNRRPPNSHWKNGVGEKQVEGVAME